MTRDGSQRPLGTGPGQTVKVQCGGLLNVGEKRDEFLMYIYFKNQGYFLFHYSLTACETATLVSQSSKNE